MNHVTTALGGQLPPVRGVIFLISVASQALTLLLLFGPAHQGLIVVGLVGVALWGFGEMIAKYFGFSKTYVGAVFSAEILTLFMTGWFGLEAAAVEAALMALGWVIDKILAKMKERRTQADSHIPGQRRDAGMPEETMNSAASAVRKKPIISFSVTYKNWSGGFEKHDD